jgi:hypothetical protein
MSCSKRNMGEGRVSPGVGGKLLLLLPAPLPPTKICVIHTETSKIGTVSETAWHFGPEDLVKTKFIIIDCKKSMDRAF